ncbi:DUF4157 domain-containing protein [Scytonema tolypothrichoides VB-61278]|nr:DUF4157 domain-containing protein [Scytonema tolypothrichoides VB-61278]
MSNRTTPQRKKATTSGFAATSVSSSTTPTVASPTRGFGIQSEPALSEKSQDKSDLQEEQATNEPSEFLTQSPLHDISRISLRPQAKIIVNQPGDFYEQEADMVAQNVMRMSVSQQQSTSGQPMTQGVLQRQTNNNNNGFEVNSHFENRLKNSQGRGGNLPSEVQSFMEPRFGVDFSNVRVHTDNSSVQMNRELGAQAFTRGSDIYFGSGKSPAKDELTAHELTHVVQQTGGKQLNRQIMRRQVPEVEGKIETPTTKDQEKTQSGPNQKQQPLQETGTEKQNNNNLLSESKGESTQPQQQQVAENSNAVEGEQSLQTEEKKNEPKNSEQDLQQNKQVNQHTELKENNESTKNNQGEKENNQGNQDNKQEINNEGEKENQQKINNKGEKENNQGNKENQQEINNNQAEKENNKNGANSRSDVPTNQLASNTDAVTNNVGVEGGGKTNQIPQQAAELNTEDPGKIIEQLKNTPPTQAFATYTEAQNALPQAFEKQRQQVQTTIPEIPAPVGLSPEQEASQKAPAEQKQDTEKEQRDPKPQKEKQDTEKEQHDPKPQKEEPKSEGKEGKKGKKGQEDKKGKKGKKGEEGEDINTSAGDRPKVDMSGSADPSQIDAEQAQSDQQVQEAKSKAMGETDRDFGDKDIFPKPSNETLKAKKELSKISADKSKGGDFPVIDPEVADGLNQGLTPYYQEKIAPEHEKYSISKQKFDADSENAKKDSNKQIADLNKETTQKQKETKQQAQQEVDEAKQDWKKEIDKTDKEYQDKAGKASKDQRQKVEDEKKKGEGQVDQEMKKAEEEAAAKKKEADEKAAAKKKEKSQRKSILAKIGGFFKDAWEGIKKAVSAIFDTVRKVVKAIFKAVKAVVNKIIDTVRNIIVGIIKAFGEVLKVIVKVVFAAFPKISKKFTDKIDQVVNKATEIVNKAADFLKKAISTVLDFLAKILDKLLELARDIVKGIMTVIGMLLTGQFKELIEGFSNLIKAAKTMPEQFETAALEELLGGGELDLDKPLSPEELAQAEQAGVNIPRPNAENSPEGEQAGNQETQEPGEMPQAPWTEENVGVDTVEDNMELSPEISEQLMQQTNGEGEVMLAESGDKNRSMDAVMSETGQKQTGGEQQPQQQQIPDDGLSPKQRADIKWQLMKQGIKKWFSDNWPILLGALIAASAVIIAAIVASGGAVLAALPIILDILMVVFAAEIIARIGGYLRDYLSKAWEGDIKGGGKSLAKALAAGAIELALLLTFEAGKLATKGAKAAGKGASKVAKGAGNAAKKAGNAVVRGSKYVINKGKVLFKGIAGTKIGKQFKKLDDLGRALLDRMRFKAFRILIKNRRFRLEGLINPWVLLASGEIKHFDDAELNSSSGKPKPGDSVTTKTGETGTVVDESTAIRTVGDNTGNKMTAGNDNSPVRRIDENGNIEESYDYLNRLEQLKGKVEEDIAKIPKIEEKLKKLKESKNPDQEKIRKVEDNIEKLKNLDEDVNKRLEVLEEQIKASEKSLGQKSPNESWDNLPALKEPGSKGSSKVERVDAEQPLNPTNMSDKDIDRLLEHYRSKKPQNSQDKRRAEWLDHEKTYRDTLKEVEKSKNNYDRVVGKATDSKEVDRKLITDAITNGNKVLWVKSKQQAERIFHKLDEMTKTGEVITMRPPKSGGDRVDLPFRGPERHPFPDSGANRSTHFNAEYIYNKNGVNLHIYWPE